MNIERKIALVTGGSSGIGLAVARELALRGARLILAARGEERLQRAVESLPRNEARNHHYFSVDVSDFAQVQKMVDWIVEQVGVPDILVNAAGAAHPGYIQELNLSIFRWMMEVNYFGTVNVVKAFLPAMIERASGTIVNIGSLASEFGLIGYTAYCGSKFALRGFTDALRMELKPLGIQVMLVLPPDTDTPQLEYENRYKPLELKYLFPELGVIPPEKVAHSVIRGLQRGHYHILPDLGSQLLFMGSRLTGNLQYPVLDFLLSRAKRRIEKFKLAA